MRANCIMRTMLTIWIALAFVLGWAFGRHVAGRPLTYASELAITRERVRTLWNENLILRAKLDPTKSNLLLAVETDPSLQPWADAIIAKREQDRIVGDYETRIRQHAL